MLAPCEQHGLMTEVIKKGGILEKSFGEVLEKRKKLYIPSR
jgi:hypothetical protein